MLDDRKLQILRAIVADYVSSMEPVGSKALVERHNLDVSPATVRNDMAVLEEEGYITQPHTSAGRIPTDKGYRLFVDRLGAIKPLSVAERRAITTFMEGAVEVDDVVMRTVRLLASITRQVAIVQYPVMTSTTVRHVDIVVLGPERAVLILVHSSGKVDQRILELHGETEEDAADLSARFTAALEGQPPSIAVDKLVAAVEALAPERKPLGEAIGAHLMELLAGDASTRVVVGGVPNLSRFGPEFAHSLRPVLEALEEHVVLLRLLSEASEADNLVVRIGHENPYEELRGTSVVSSSYGNSSTVRATLGIVGPTRMDYPSTMAAVRAVASYVGRFLSEG
ncbi:heat-inducible transcriptional repressor HrcA [Propionicicella superfundia]|uniref:heat-inducible transcriptional repressor HrcA n=1 Tax=Propionicicella superfundia TaxID=348582 RepID=UPI000401075A|nr:heat-inducible transcriptional repressor HrcA [Propionicicella superfundia]